MRSLRHLLADDLRYLRFPYDELLHPLGMYHTHAEPFRTTVHRLLIAYGLSLIGREPDISRWAV